MTKRKNRTPMRSLNATEAALRKAGKRSSQILDRNTTEP